MRKNTMKKLISIMLFATLSVSLLACGNSATGGNKSDAATNDDNTQAETTEAASAEQEEKETDTDTSDTENAATDIPLTSSDLNVVVGEQAYMLVPIILDQGWFDEVFGPNNISIEVAKFNNGPEMIESFTADKLDIGFMGMQPAISGVVNDAGISVIASFLDSPSNIVIETRKDTGITSVKDLKGKTVGTAIGCNTYSLIVKALEEEGLSVDKDVNFVNLDLSTVATALESGEVDAVAGYAVQFEQIADMDGDIFYTIKDATGYGISEDLIVARKEFASEHPDVVANLFVLFQRAIDFIEENRDEAISITAQYYGHEEAFEESRLEREIHGWIDEETLTKDIDGFIQFMYDGELIPTRPDVQDAVDFTYFKKAFGE